MENLFTSMSLSAQTASRRNTSALKQIGSDLLGSPVSLAGSDSIKSGVGSDSVGSVNPS